MKIRLMSNYDKASNLMIIIEERESHRTCLNKSNHAFPKITPVDKPVKEQNKYMHKINDFFTRMLKNSQGVG